MKAIYLVKNGIAKTAFEIREVKIAEPKESEVQIKVEAFGLNFADVMARKGLYRDCPPLPCVLGYDVVGTVNLIGKNVSNLKIGERVTAFTRFGAYAEFVNTDCRAAAKISADFSSTFATSLATQYCTAYFASHEAAKVYTRENVLVHAAAGGVGTALVQLLKLDGAKIFGTCGNDEKINFLKELGVDYPINYKTSEYKSEIKKILGNKKLDTVFDSLGGKYIRDGMKLLGSGGRMVCFGGAELNSATNIFSKFQKILQFGFYHPGILMMASKSLIGVNMLRIADNKPEVLEHVLHEVISLAEKKLIVPIGGKEFHVSKLATAHEFLESRNSIGKIAVRW